MSGGTMFMFAMVFGGVFGGVAHAEDGKGRSALECTATAGTTYVSSGRVFNSAGSSMTLQCPVINDTIASSYSMDDAVVWAIDLSSTSRVSCTFYERYQTTSSASGSSFAASYPSGSGDEATFTDSSPIALTFSGSGTWSDIRTEAAWGYLTCSVPAISGTNRSGVLSYYFLEV